MKIRGKILPVLLKGVIAPIICTLGFYTLLMISPLEITYILLTIWLLIYGLILRGNYLTDTLISWVISIAVSLFVCIPTLLGFFNSLPMLYYYLLPLIFIYIISTFISTTAVMLMYKYIQKKRMAKKLDEGNG
jgi:hypothetical protein